MNAPSPVSPSRPVQALGRLPVHPVLVAVWPALALWAANVDEAQPADVWPAVWIPVAATVGAWLLAWVGLRSWSRGALVASVGAAVFLNAGRIVSGGAGVATVAISAALLVAAVVGARRLRWTALVPTTAVLNVLATTLVLLALPPLVAAWGPGSSRSGASVDGSEGGDGLAGRDIWYIVPDRYPRADTLASVFDYDNTPFLSGLEEQGFQVADRALANYPKTAHSLVATWNLAPIEELIPDPPADGSDWQPLYRLLRDHRLGRILTDAGYEYIHLGSWFGPTATASSADRVLRVDTDSEFVTVWQTQTLLPAFQDERAEGGGMRERQRRHSSYQLDQLDRLARQRSDQPRFILAHITLPHEPYVFGPDGEYQTRAQEGARTREENITNQVTYLNTRLQALVDELLSGPPETWPVIVIQSDEGPHPEARTGPAYDWTTAPDEVLAEKLRTLSAILLPGSDLELPEDLTGVNTWRHVLDATVGTDLGPIPDPPIKVFPGEDHLYDLHDVSDRIE